MIEKKKERDLGGISSNKKTRPFGFWGRQIEPDFDIFILNGLLIIKNAQLGFHFVFGPSAKCNSYAFKKPTQFL